MSESFIPSFPHSPIRPYDAKIVGGQTVRVNARSAADARRKALARLRKGARVERVEPVYFTGADILAA